MTHEDYTENKHHIFHTGKKGNSKEEKKKHHLIQVGAQNLHF